MATLPPPPKKFDSKDPNLGITFNEIHSDEPHEEINAIKAELYNKPLASLGSDSKNPGMFNVAKVFKDEHIETGMIVSDKKATRPGFFENVQLAFSEWVGGITHALPTEHTPHSTASVPGKIPQAPVASQVMPKHAAATVTPPRNDHHIVVEKIRTFKQDVARINKTDTSPTPPETPSIPPPPAAPVLAPKISENKTVPDTSKITIPKPPAAKLEVDKKTNEIKPTVVPKAPVIPTPPKVTEAKADKKVTGAIPPSIPTPPIATSVPPAKIVTGDFRKSNVAPAVTHHVDTSDIVAKHMQPTPVPQPAQKEKESVSKLPQPLVPKTPAPIHVAPVVAQPIEPAKKATPRVPSPVSTAPVSRPLIRPAEAVTSSWTHVIDDEPMQKESAVTVAKVVPQHIPETPTHTEPPVPQPPVTRSEVFEKPTPAPTPIVETVPQHVPVPVAPVVHREVPPPVVPSPLESAPTPRAQTMFHSGSGHSVEQQGRIDDAPLVPTREEPVIPQALRSRSVPENSETTHSTPVPKASPLLRIAFIGIFAVVIVGGGVMLFHTIRSGTSGEVVNETSETTFPVSSEEVSVPAADTLVLDGTAESFMSDARTKIETAQAGRTELRTLAWNAPDATPISGTQFLSFMEARMNSKAIRSFSGPIKIGSVTTESNQPYIILESTNFDLLFSGMLSWETFIYEDLAPFFGTTIPQNPVFVDAVRGNNATRILYNEKKEEILLYSIINQRTVIITTNGAALAKLLEAN